MSEPSVPLGRFDVFRDVAAWDDETAQTWIDTLDRRAAARDQHALRSRLLELARLAPGDSVVEIGCGTGALLCDVARAVGREGRVVGFEPQPRLAEAAQRRIAATGLSAIVRVECATAESLPLERDSVAACLAQTVLIHLPGHTLGTVLSEMVRVVRPGGGSSAPTRTAARGRSTTRPAS